MTNQGITTRVYSLDYLRGLMALTIMIYHYFSWTFYPLTSKSFLGVMGIYGVSVFYVLSGLTLYLVYHEKLSLNTLLGYFIKRAFRILPLLWLTIFLTIVLLQKTYDYKTILMNVTGVFGFIAHDKYIPTGAWSIGNELVFYSIFPLIILLDKKLKKYVVEVFFLLSIGIGFYYAFFLLDKTQALGGAEWKTYIHPLNQLFLFTGGITIGKFLRDKRYRSLGILFIFIFTSFLFIYPVEGNQMNLVTGFNRLLFSFMIFILTIGFLFTSSKKKTNVGRSFKSLGEASYSIYLMHPIVYWYVAKFMDRTNQPILFFSISIILTFFISYLTYFLFEKRFIFLGKKVSKRIIAEEGD